MLAAIAAARRQASVLLLEQNDRPGKKLLSTGNGKCNYTNEKQGISFYRGDDPAFVMPVFSQFDKTALVSLFAELGIYPFVRDGYYLSLQRPGVRCAGNSGGGGSPAGRVHCLRAAGSLNPKERAPFSHCHRDRPLPSLHMHCGCGRAGGAENRF